MTESVYTLVYVSRPSALLTDNELENLLVKCRATNERIGITGVLLYTGERFIQLLEGSESAVKDLYEQIQKDERHHSVVTLFEHETTERIFPDWSMGLKIAQEGDIAWKGEHGLFGSPDEALQLIRQLVIAS